MNPFKLPDVDQIGYSFPLNPYKYASHTDYYAPVDNTLQAYEDYVEFIDSFNGEPKRHSTLVYGESGCGKTSLIYRILSHISSMEWNNVLNKIYVFDFNQENVAGLSAKDKVEQILYLIALSLRQGATKVADVVASEFEQKLNNQTVALLYLQNALQNINIVPAFFLPPVETATELDLYMKTFSRSNWFHYLETSQYLVVERSKCNYRMSSTYPIQLLNVNPLQPTDAKGFLGTRLSLLKDSPNKEIVFADDALEEFLTATGTRGGASLRELIILCSKVFDLAIEYKQSTITFNDMAKVAIGMRPRS